MKFFETPPIMGIQADSSPVFVTVGFPSRVFLQKVMVIQYSGPLGAFTVDIFSNPDVASGATVSEPGAGKVPDDIFRVAPTLTASAAGELMEFNLDCGFYNHRSDEQSVRPPQVEREIYVRITPAGGAGPKLFCLLLGAEFRE